MLIWQVHIMQTYKTYKTYKNLGENNMKKTAIAAALLLTVGSVNAATVTSLDVASGVFSMNAPIGSGGDSAIGAHVINMGAYQGDEAVIATGDGTSGYVTWDFGFFGPVTNFSTAASIQDGVPSGNSVPGGGPAITAVTDDVAGSITVDLSSFFANWNGTSFSQGDAGTVGTYDAVTGDFFLSWSKLIVGGSFGGKTGYWELAGTANVSAVPVPAAVWLFGSGLVGLAGIARRRKAA